MEIPRTRAHTQTYTHTHTQPVFSYLFGLAYAVQRQRHHVGAVEDVAVPAATCHRGDLTAVEADGHLVGDLGFRGRGRFRHGAAQVEPCGEHILGGGGREDRGLAWYI